MIGSALHADRAVSIDEMERQLREALGKRFERLRLSASIVDGWVATWPCPTMIEVAQGMKLRELLEEILRVEAKNK